MSHASSFSAEERLKELKETYFKLFSDRDNSNKYVFPTDDYLLHYRRLFPNTSHQSAQEERNSSDETSNRSPLDDNFLPKSGTKLKLRPILEEINKKGPMEKRNFMLHRMDELAGTRPARVMDYVKKQYPTLEEIPEKNENSESNKSVGWWERLKTHRATPYAGDPRYNTRVSLGVHDDSSANTFFILGEAHRCIRDYLVSNGWIEKFCGPEERNQLIRCLQGLPTGDNRTLGRMLATDPVKFIWVNGFINWSLINNSIIVSRIPSSSYYFSKTALACSIRDLYPFLYQKGLIDVKTPRTYEVRSPEDMKYFTKQFRINACVSLLRKFAAAMQPESNVQMFSELDGSVPLDCVDFAVQRVVEMIRYVQHADLDEWHFSVVSEEDWNVFIYRFYDIVHQDAKFQMNHHNINVPKLAYACEKLCTIFGKYFPDTKHDGHRNLWIVKPSNGSCGRGVKVFKRLNEIQQYCKPANSYVVQKYIENPLLIYQTKFDVRQWFLITSVYPLVIWMYNECYLRFCSQQFSLSNVHESVHLCNNSIQYKYKNGARSPHLPNDNMWDDSTFQTYLSEKDSATAWLGIKSKMKQAIIASCLVSQDKMYHRTNSFHLYGADFMITPDYDVWLIEINTHPSMKYSTSVTTRMCKEVLKDTLKVGLDRRSNPQADTGKFVEIYRQQTHMPTVGVPASASGVNARKIRLLNAINPKDPTTKTFLETSRAPPKFGKWLSYTSVASYKKHNKINFKYVVLRHTDMPLDPGDSITQRDIGYAGVLDKVNVTENVEETNEETMSTSDEVAEKEKTKVSPAPASKPPNQITLHRKVVSKLKAKEKENIGDESETISNKTANSKLRINSDEIVTQVSLDAKQNEAPKPNAETEVQQSKHVVGNVVEVRNVHEIIKDKNENTSKEAAPKVKDKVTNSKKNPSTVEDTKNVSKLEKSLPEDKPSNSKKQNNQVVKVDNTEKNKTTKSGDQAINTEKNKTTKTSEKAIKSNIPNSEKAKTTKKVTSQGKNVNARKQTSVVVKTRNATPSKVIKDSSMIFVLSDTKKNKTGISGKDVKKRSNSTVKSSVKSRVGSATPIKKQPTPTGKVSKEKSPKESTKALSISKLKKEENLKKQLGIRNHNEKKNKPSYSQADNRTDTTSKPPTNPVQRTNPDTTSSGGHKSKKGPAKKENGHLSDQKELKSNSAKDRSKQHSKSLRKSMSSRRGNKSISGSRAWSKGESFYDDDDEILFNPHLNPQEVIFMLSDSDISFKTAHSVSDEETASYEDSSGQSFSGEEYSESQYPFQEERINTNSIKRYTNRNKYCE